MNKYTYTAGTLTAAVIVFFSVVAYDKFTNEDTSDEEITENVELSDNITVYEGDDTSSLDNLDFNNSNMSDKGTSSKANMYPKSPGVLADSEIKNKKSVITTSEGVIELELYADLAPIAVSNHVFLANEDFYDGLIFHRRVERFVIQGGDPTGTGSGGPGYQFEDEFIPVDKYPRTQVMDQYGQPMDVIDYKKGALAMANSGPNTNGSQFFIMLEDGQLPPLYTIFGQVISGRDVVDKLPKGAVIEKIEIMDM
ncbi:MAG: peptidylprolyl isomerase [Candidatus Dojkabacteria bacterium]|nr:peptidylprolyl isomerase [Candidatus Dojkabacteria bacterium]MDQ7020414.1 peptidylprolyl isomerase [Candidatus Dojkabacteria bacterium]